MIGKLILYLKKIKYSFSGIPMTCRIGPNVSLSSSKLGRYVNLAHDSSVVNSFISDRTSIGRYSIIRNSEIGKFCAVSWFVTIGADHHPTERISGSGAFFLKLFGLVEKNSSKGEVKRCIIGNDVLIGCNTVIKAGVTIGDGAIIGSGSVVVHDIPPYHIAVGNPARVIKKRFSDDIIDRLIAMEWWNFDDDFLKENILMFQKPLDFKVIEQIEVAKRLKLSKCQ